MRGWGRKRPSPGHLTAAVCKTGQWKRERNCKAKFIGIHTISTDVKIHGKVARPVCGRTDKSTKKCVELRRKCSLRPKSKKLPSHCNTVIVIYLVFIGVSVICIPVELIILLRVQVKLLFLASVPAENEGFAAVWSTSMKSCRRILQGCSERKKEEKHKSK